MKNFKIYISLFFLLVCSSCKKEGPVPDPGILQISSLRAGTIDISTTGSSANIPVDKPIVINFSSALKTSSIQEGINLKLDVANVAFEIAFLNENRSVSLLPKPDLLNNKEYTLTILDKVVGENGERFPGITIKFKTIPGKLEILSFTINGQSFQNINRIQNIDQEPVIELVFSKEVDPQQVIDLNIGITGKTNPQLSLQLLDQNKKLRISPAQKLNHFEKYSIILSRDIKGKEGEEFSGFSREFFTRADETPKFPVVSDEELLTLIQKQHFKYFWDFAHPNSGLARERNNSGDLVTSGGSGFGIMAIIVGIERNFITRQEGVDRVYKIARFLEKADRFHGVWSHWINGNTGKVIPFSVNDNGGDIVETAFLVQGLLTFRQYLNPDVAKEKELIDIINELWQSVEWNWYTRGGQNVLYWHWSPDKQWAMNHQVRGFNESLVVYVLAAASPGHTINTSVYHEGWARNGGMVNGKNFYGIKLPLGYDFGGPLFFAHYSFLGLDPRKLSDQYANYWEQNKNHTLINRQHSIVNPNNFIGYSEKCWGITASDNHLGYNAHSPTNDLGVITPTAALSSFPYTPEYSMQALKFFYYTLGDKLWGNYGFYDAFNPTVGWYANSFLAIDQGPIITMIENHRTGKLWDLFMSAPEVKTGLDKLGFSY
jgi:hypothetical protein